MTIAGSQRRGETTLRGVCIGVCSRKVVLSVSIKIGTFLAFWRTPSPPVSIHAMTRRSVRIPPMMRSAAVFGALERVEHRRAKAGDVAVIPRHQCQAIGQRGRREQAIDSREGPYGAHASPLIGHRVIDAPSGLRPTPDSMALQVASAKATQPECCEPTPSYFAWGCFRYFGSGPEIVAFKSPSHKPSHPHPVPCSPQSSHPRYGSAGRRGRRVPGRASPRPRSGPGRRCRGGS